MKSKRRRKKKTPRRGGRPVEHSCPTCGRMAVGKARKFLSFFQDQGAAPKSPL